MTDFVLPILPDGSLASSVVTTVWAGVLVVCFFNLRFGWVLSGLVVPGYIVPLILIQPVSAGVIVIEASVVFGVFWLISERLAGPYRWSSFFGRDRFMGLILVAVAVRLVFDGWLLPIAAEALSNGYGWDFDWQNNLHSFGLVVVALFANQLWKPGFSRGMFQALVMIGITYIIVRYGLMEFTNFRISSVAYLYEDFASSILASPKAYIILIVTCMVASRLNLAYGWDFSGILIPALLALQWYQPWKIVTSVAEALLIFFVASALLSSRLFAGKTVEGAGKTLLFFNISFVYKIALGHGLTVANLEYRITDFYGFGYLLPTLIALKAHDKGILTRVLRTTLQTSFIGAVIGNLIGLILNLIVPQPMKDQQIPKVTNAKLDSASHMLSLTVGASLLDAAQNDNELLRVNSAVFLRRALEMINAGDLSGQMFELLNESGYKMTSLEDGKFAINSKTDGGTLFIFNPSAKLGGCHQVYDAAETPGIATATLFLNEKLGGRWFAITGNGLRTDKTEQLSPMLAFNAAIGECIEVMLHKAQQPVLSISGSGSTFYRNNVLKKLLPEMRWEFEDSTASKLKLAPKSLERLLAAIPVTSPEISVEKLSRNELAFLQSNVFAPLVNDGNNAVPAVRSAAASVGFSVELEKSANPAIVIRKNGNTNWQALLRPGATGPILLSDSTENLGLVPRSLFVGMNAKALIASNSRGLIDNEADPEMSALIQSILRNSPRRVFVIQLSRRPKSYANADQTRLLLATDKIGQNDGNKALGDQIQQLGFSIAPISGGPKTAGLEITPTAQVRFIQQVMGGRTAVIWVRVPDEMP